MADTDPAIEPDPALEADPAPAPQPETDPAPEGEQAAEENPFAPVPGEPANFGKTYVDKIRRAGERYRLQNKEYVEQLERLKPYEEAFEGWEPDQVGAWGEFLAAAKEDPGGALTALIRDGFAYDRESAAALLTEMFGDGGDQEPTPTPTPSGGEDPDRPLTLRDLEARDAAKQAEAEQAAAVQSVKSEAKELGYDPAAAEGSIDEFRYQRLLHLAVNKYGNNLKDAHEALVAEEQAATKQRIEALAREAEDLPVPSGGGGAGVTEAAPADWESTRKGASEFLAAARTANP